MDEQIHNYFQGKLTPAEQNRLLHQIENDASLRAQYTAWQNTYALLDLIPGKDDYQKGENSYTAFIGVKKKRTLRLSSLIKYAAALALVVVSTWWITNTTIQHQLSSEINTLYVPAGQRARLTLQDGTTVWLNAKSQLTYPSRFSEDKREVSLVGEAFFDVSKNPSAPFTVSIKDVTVTVLGTEFNVLGYSETDYIQTSLLEGSIIVHSDHSNKTVMLSPDQEVIIQNGLMNVTDIKQHAYFLWKDGIYSFEREKFGKIINKLELYYDTRIIVKDKEILDFIYTGKFRQQDGIDEILRIIQKIHNFKIDRDRENNIITLSK